MPVFRTLSAQRWTVLAVAVTGVCLLVVFAARADARVAGGNPRLTLQDIAVGLAFMLAAAFATGGLGQRLLVAAVGPAWLAGSVWHSALSLHQAVLAVSLALFPTARISGVVRLLFVAAALPVAGELVPQLGVAASFAVVAAHAFGAAGRWRAQAAYPICAAGLVAAVLVFAWWSVRRDPASSPVTVYELTLIAVAIGFPFATRGQTRFRLALADRVLGDKRFVAVSGLRFVLADMLGDDTLWIDVWDEGAAHVLGSGDDVREEPDGAFRLRVLDGERLLACVRTRSHSVVDKPTSVAICAAVRLAVVNDRLRREETQRVLDVERSRLRLLAAADRERARIATKLRAEAGHDLGEARGRLAALPHGGDPELSALISFVSAEVAAAAAEVERIVAGVPPFELGAGGLPAAIAMLARRCPLPVTLSISDDTTADSAAETALFYVCSEALANAAKYSRAARIEVRLRSDGQRLLLSVRDDGAGGADPTGSGLQGLADRLSAVGGYVDIRSPDGGGTTITAVVGQTP